MSFRRTSLLIAACFALAVTQLSVRAATIRFQGQTYTLNIANIGTGANISVVGDLIFVRQGDQKFLLTPTDPGIHGDFDFASQRYYILDRSTGNVNAYSSIDAAVIDLTTLNQINLTQQNPPFPNAPLESFSKPLGVPASPTVATDICIIENTQLLGYRTDGPTTTDEIIYSITRQGASSIDSQFTINLKNADQGNNFLNAFLEYDPTKDTFLVVQLSLDAANNTSTLSRISSFKRSDGTLLDQVILDQNVLFPNFGHAGGIAVDPEVGTIYLLDRDRRQLITMTPLLPSVAGITPNSGTLAGGTAITISGVNLPSDAQVFFGGVPATNISVSPSGDTITATTPAHTIGTVDVTVTGTGITTTLVLAGAYTYVNEPPVAHLHGSPTSGPAPLVVSFSVEASDVDGSIVSRIIDFGDSTSFTFPANTGITSTSHTYAADGVYSATVTVKDDLGAAATDTITIIVGATELVLRGLSFNVLPEPKPNPPPKGGGDPPPVIYKDKMTLKGEVIVPEDADIANGKLTIAFVNVNVDSSNALTPCPDEFLLATAFKSAVQGGEFCLDIDGKGRVSNSVAKFSMKPVKKRGFPADTQSFSFTGTGFSLRKALEDAGVLSPADQSRASVRIIVRIETDTGTILEYTRVAVVDIKTGSKSTAKLTRH